MQILKSKNERMGTFNQYVPSNPHETVINLDKVAERAKALALMPTSFVDEQGMSATEAYNKMLDDKAEQFAATYSPHFAAGESTNFLIVREGNLIAWNMEALKLFIRTGNSYFSPFDKMKREIEKQLLCWARVDYSKLDQEQWRAAVKQSLMEFAYQYNQKDYNP